MKAETRSTAPVTAIEDAPSEVAIVGSKSMVDSSLKILLATGENNLLRLCYGLENIRNGGHQHWRRLKRVCYVKTSKLMKISMNVSSCNEMLVI